MPLRSAVLLLEEQVSALYSVRRSDGSTLSLTSRPQVVAAAHGVFITSDELDEDVEKKISYGT